MATRRRPRPKKKVRTKGAASTAKPTYHYGPWTAFENTAIFQGLMSDAAVAHFLRRPLCAVKRRRA